MHAYLQRVDIHENRMACLPKEGCQLVRIVVSPFGRDAALGDAI